MEIHQYKILLVDDNRDLTEMITEILRQSGYENIVTAGSVAEAMEVFQKEQPDMAVLDVMLPDGDGFRLFQKIRERSRIPILFLSAKDEDRDRLFGLGLGADDYITKPFSLAVLRARVDAALRRAAPAKPAAVFQQDGFVFNFDALTFTAGGRAVQLSQTEQRLLRLLVENRGHTVPRGTLVDRIWTDGAEYVDENALSVTVGRLRRKLGAPAPIKTVYGVGYGWAVDA